MPDCNLAQRVCLFLFLWETLNNVHLVIQSALRFYDLLWFSLVSSSGWAKLSFDLCYRLKMKLLPGFVLVTVLMEIAIAPNEQRAESGRTKPQAECRSARPLLHPGETLCTASLIFHNQGYMNSRECLRIFPPFCISKSDMFIITVGEYRQGKCILPIRLIYVLCHIWNKVNILIL